MASTYTLNNGIELIGTGEQSGTWGDTTNTNLSLLDTALDGQVTVTLATAGTSGSPNALPISDGSASDGRNRMIIFADGGDLGATAYVQLTPNDAEKIIYIRNDLSGSRSILFFQGTYNASNDYEVPAGTTAVIYFDGGGTGAIAANVFNNAYFDSLRLGSLSVTAILDEDDMSSDSATALATQQSIKAYVDTQVGANNELSEVLANGNTSGGNAIQMTTTDELQFRDTALKISSSADGQLDIDADTEIEIVAPTVDIDASTAMTIDTAALTVTGAVDFNTSLNVDGTVTSDGLTVAGNVSVDGGTIKLDGNYPDQTDNVALGNNALDALTAGGSYNTAIGANALTENTSGDLNVAVGSGSLSSNTTGSNNSGVGTGALAGNSTGSYNTAFGRQSLLSNTTASGNTMAGYQAGYLVGDEIVATSIVSGVNYTIQTSGSTDFTLIGAADSNPGTTFTATGAGTGTGTASANANYNTFVGYQAGDLIVGGSKNSILGSFDGNQNTIDIRNSNNNIVLSDGDGNPRLAYVSANAELVINEQSADVDFRVESDSNTHALFVDASTDRVGINTDAPQQTLEVRGKVLIEANNSGATSIPGNQLILSDSDTSIDADQLMGQIAFNTADLDNPGTAAKIQTRATNTFGSGELQIWSGTAGTLKKNVHFRGDQVVFNEDSNDMDFRVESDTLTHALFVDASTDRVSVGGDTPTARFYVNNTNPGDNNTAARITGGTSYVSDGNWEGPLQLDWTQSSNDGYIRMLNIDLTDSGSGNQTNYGIYVNGEDENFFSSNLDVRGSARFNESGEDNDFRVESDSVSNMLLVDAGNNSVAINRSYGIAPLHVSGTANDTVAPENSYAKITAQGLDGLAIGSISSSPFSAWIQSGYTDNTFSPDWNNGYPLALNPVNANVVIGATNVIESTDGLSIVSGSRDNLSIQYTGTSGGHTSALRFYDFRSQLNARINNNLINDGAGTAEAHLEFGTAYNGTFYERLSLSRTEAVFNDDGADTDFRVESDSQAYAFFVDAGTGGIRADVYDFTINNQDTGPALTLMSGLDYNSFLMGAAENYGSNNSADNKWSWNWRGRNAGSTQHYNFLYDEIGNKEMFRVQADASQYAVVVNDGGYDHDFRVESDTSAYGLYLDAGHGGVGINGAGSSSYQLTVLTGAMKAFGFMGRNTDGSNRSGLVFYSESQAAIVGQIQLSNSATTYVTSSDYRLKENVIDMTGAIDRVMQLRPKRFSWICEHDDGPNVDGFLAHEVQSIVPSAVSGEKDAVDDKGNPEYQGIDHSKLVPVLTAALQEAITKIETLEARIAALENA